MRISDWSSDVCSSDLQMVKDAERFAEEDKKKREAAEAKNNAESLIHTTEQQLSEHGDKVDAGLKSEIETAIAATRSAVEGGDAEAMKAKAQELAQIAMKLDRKSTRLNSSH